MHGDIHELKGKRTVDFVLPNGQKYLVCTYGKHYEHQWATKLDDSRKQCRLVVVHKKRDSVTATLTCK